MKPLALNRFLMAGIAAISLGGAQGAEPVLPVDDTLAPRVETLPNGHTIKMVKCYPNGLMRAYCVSFDDGNFEPDQRVADSLRRRGLHGTFFLNSMHEQSQDALQHPETYAGFEVASHGAHHRGFGKMDMATARAELEQDQKILGARFGCVVAGFAYPYGDVPKKAADLDRLESLMSERGIIYARMCGTTGAFRPPENFLRWIPDCGLGPGNIKTLDRFLALPAEDSVRVMMEFTHSRDVGKEQFPWATWEAYLDRLAQEKSIWSVTFHEFAQYVIALRRITVANGEISNPDPDTTVWMRVDGRLMEIPPGRTVQWPEYLR